MRKVLLTLALVCLLALPVLAQFRQGGGAMDATALLSNKSVQEELKLTDDQKKLIAEAKDARDKAFTKMREDKNFDDAKKVGEDYTAAIKKVIEKLDEKQLKRLVAIEVQQAEKANNPKVFLNEEVQKALKFTSKQKDLAKDTCADIEKDLKEMRDEAKGDFKKFAEIFKKAGELNKGGYEKISKSLDEDQVKALKDIKGEAFDLKVENPFKDKFGKDKKKKDDKKDDF